MRANSLALRLFLSATVWTVLILFATGVVLSTLNRQAVERSFDRRLSVYLRTLVAEVAAPEEGGERPPQSLGEPLFELPLSGWYWQVTKLNTAKPEVRSSRSLWDGGLPHPSDQDAPVAADGTRRTYVDGPEDQRLRLIERTVDLGDDGRYLIAVAGDSQEIEEETRSFDRVLVVTFGTLIVALLLTTMFQVRFGLAPLKRISEGLAAIRGGTAERLEGQFPFEIAPLARETNALIEANREIVERARLATRLTVVGGVTDVPPVVSALARTMEKIYHDRGIAIDVEAPTPVRFKGEQPDLEEMVGNLVDNACKWARSRVSIEVMTATDGAQSLAHILVDDDGPGLDADQREQVTHRGQRLDETKPGSGLGLSIVVELAALYGGSLTLDTAPIGGLRAELVLPAA